MQNKGEGESPKATPRPMSYLFSLSSLIPSFFRSGGSAGSKQKAPHATAASGSVPSVSPATVSVSSMLTKGGLKLPGALEQMISSYLNAKDAARLSTTAGQMSFLLQHVPAIPMKQRKLVHYFLRRVVRGQHGLMKQMLEENIEWLCKRERVTDCSGRVFESISGFEYALWALDKHQWDDMLACLPRDGKGHLTEKSLKVVAELKKQYAEVKTKGVTYTRNGVTKTESHYDFVLISELQKQVNAQNAAGDNTEDNIDWNSIDKQWCEGVGGAQRLCPMHVVDEYCSTTPFGPAVPTFNSRPQPANGLRKFYNTLSHAWESWFGVNSRPQPANGFYNSLSHVWESWFRVDSKLGVDFAIACMGASNAGGLLDAGRYVEYAMTDLVAMKVLRETRTNNFSALEAQLNSLRAPTEVASSVLGVEAQHRPGM